MNKYKYLFILPLLFFTFFLTKNVYAESKMLLQDSSGNTLQTLTNMGQNSVYVPNVKYILLYFDIDTASNSQYNLKAQWSYDTYTSSVERPTLSWLLLNGNAVSFTNTLGINEEQINYDQTTSHWYTDSINFSTNANTFGTTQVQLTYTLPRVVTLLSINWHDKTLTYLGGTGNDTSSVINSGVNNIINNDNSNTQQIINSQEETTNAIEDLNDTFENTNTTESDITNQFSQMHEISDTPISDLLTLPLVLLNKLYNSLSESCSAYTIPFDFSGGNNTLTFQCINLGHEKYLGRIVWGYIDDLFCIFMIYNIGKMIIWFFNGFTTLKDNFEYVMDPNANTRGLF